VKKILKWLKRHDACSEGYSYSNQFTDPEKWWNSFNRGDWMLWVIWRCIDRRDEVSLRKLTLVKARCAKLVLHLMTDERSRNAVEVAEQFGLGNVTRQELNAAADAAYAAAAYAAAYATAYATAYPAYAAYAAAYATAYATAYAAADAAYAAGAARKKEMKQMADIVRKHYTTSEIVGLICRGKEREQ
jgi:hypothetical protein